MMVKWRLETFFTQHFVLFDQLNFLQVDLDLILLFFVPATLLYCCLVNLERDFHLFNVLFRQISKCYEKLVFVNAESLYA